MMRNRRQRWRKWLQIGGFSALLVALGACGGDGTAQPQEQQQQEEEQDNQQQDNQQADEVYEVGGTVAGLDAEGLVVANEVGDTVDVEAGDDEFAFETEYEDGDFYEVTVDEQPADQRCDVSDAAGVVDGADVDDVTVECLSDAAMTVELDEDNSRLAAVDGEPMNVVVQVENTGDEFGADDVALSVDGQLVDERPAVGIEPGEQRTILLEWTPHGEEPGEYTGEVATADDSVDVELTVVEEAYFEVGIDEDVSELQAVVGDQISVVAEVDNLGDSDGVQDIVMEVDGQLADLESALEVAPGDTETVSLTWTPGADDVGEATITVAGEDDDATTEATVIEHQPFFDVDIDEDDSTLDVVAGETVSVVADIDNAGDEEGTQDVRLWVDGQLADVATDVNLDEGDSEQVTLDWQTAEADVGDATVIVESDDDEATTDATVAEAAFVAIELVTTQVSQPAGETVEIDATAENIGDEEVTTDIDLRVGGAVVDTEDNLTLEGGDSEQLTFSWDTDEDDAGSHVAEVVGDDDQASLLVELHQPAFFEVSIDIATSELLQGFGDPVLVVADVTNSGELTGEQNIELEIDGQLADTVTGLELDPNETVTLELEGDTCSEEFTATVLSDDATHTVDRDSGPGAEVGYECDDGRIFAGGFGDYIYYVMPEDEGELYWEEDNTDETGADSDTDGVYNTDAIIGSKWENWPSERVFPAAEACTGLDAHGYDNWFLPALDELERLYDYKDTIGGFADEIYWVSTESGSSLARTVSFDTGSTGLSHNKSSFENNVRCMMRE